MSWKGQSVSLNVVSLKFCRGKISQDPQYPSKEDDVLKLDLLFRFAYFHSPGIIFRKVARQDIPR